MTIVMNIRQVISLYNDVKDLPGDTKVELNDFPDAETIELTIPSREEADFLFADGSTGY